MKKGMTRRRLLALVLCLAMLFSCVPQGAIPVFAAGDEASQGQTETGETTTPTEPEVTTEPTQPEVTTVPTEPEVTVEPTEPEVTTEPTQPEDTTAPTEPEVTTEPTELEDTAAPTEPEVTTEPTELEDTAAPTEPEVTTEPTEPQNPAEPAQPQNPAVPLAGTVVASGPLTDTITYTITEDSDESGTFYSLTLSGTGDMPDYDWSTYDTSPWYPYHETLRNVILEDGIVSVGASNFYDCSGITSLTLPDSLTEIGEEAFRNCTGLPSVTFPANLKTIGSAAFYNSGLQTLELPAKLETISERAFSSCRQLSGQLNLEGLSKLTSIGGNAFSGCSNITSLVLPEGLISIGGQAFVDCANLASVSFPESLKSIGSHAFGSCTGLTVLKLPANLTDIGGYAFAYCENLTSVSFPESLVTIGDSAFYYAGLTDLNLPANLTAIGRHAFSRCENLTSVIFPESLTTIGDYAFADCTGLAVLDLPESLTTIGSSAFADCTGLTALVLPEKLTTIGNSAFRNCTGILSMDLSNCTSIGDSLFQGCTSLEKVVLPTGMTEMPVNMFSGCTQLSEIENLAALQVIGNNAFRNCSLLDLSQVITDATTYIGSYAFKNCPGISLTKLPDSLITIGDTPFSGCENVSIVDISNCTQLQSIGSRVFQGMEGIKYLDFSDRTNLQIGSYAFADCPELVGVKLGGQSVEIDSYAFSNCAKLQEVDFSKCTGSVSFGSYVFQNTPLQELSIQNASTVSVGKDAFRETQLSSIQLTDITESLTIQSGAFNSCSQLAFVDFSGSTGMKSLLGNLFSGSPALHTVDFSGCTGITALPQNLFTSDCSPVRVDFTGCTGIKELSFSRAYQYAFNGCKRLEELDFTGCTGLEELGRFMSGCTNLRSVTLPGNAFWISDLAPFGGCTGLETITTWLPDEEVADTYGEMLSLMYAHKVVEDVSFRVYSTDGKIVFSKKFLEGVSQTPYDLCFADLNSKINVVMDENAQSVSAASPLNRLNGEIYVDGFGAVYFLHENAATLAYVPGGIDSYTVPSSIEGVPVTAVGTEAIRRAKDLSELIFKSPHQVTLADRALSNCLSLQKVNDATTETDAEKLFGQVGQYAFVGTGLLPKITGTIQPLEEKIEFVLGNAGEARFVVEGKMDAPVYKKDEISVTGTGNPLILTVGIDGAENDKYRYRLYFRTLGDKFNFSGTDMDFDTEYQDENGNVKYKLNSTDIPGLYYIDVEIVSPGFTWTRQITLQYDVLTQGGALLVWAEVTEKENPFQISVSPSAGYYHVCWETETKPYQFETVDPDMDRPYSFTRKNPGDPVVLDRNLTWSVSLKELSREGSIYEQYPDLALDSAKKKTVQLEVSLPDGLEWNFSDGILEQLQGGAYLRVVSESHYQYRDYNVYLGDTLLLSCEGMHKEDEFSELFASMQDGKLVVEIVVDTTAVSLTIPFKFTGELIRVADEQSFDYDNFAGKIVVNPAYIVEYEFSGTVKYTAASVRYTPEPPVGELEYSNSYSGNYYIPYAELAQYVLTVKNPTVRNDKAVQSIETSLPDLLKLTPESIQSLFSATGEFSNDALSQYLTLTIVDARVYKYENPEALLGSAVQTDGTGLTQITGEMTDIFGTEYDENVKVVLRSDEDGNVIVKIGNAAEENVAVLDLPNWLVQHGVSTVAETRFHIKWDFGVDGKKVDSGATLKLVVPFCAKSSFQRIEQDVLHGLDTTVPNELLLETRFIDARQNVVRNLLRDYRIDYEVVLYAEDEKVTSEEAITFNAQITNTWFSKADNVPLVALLSGEICVLAEMEDNAGQPWINSGAVEIFTDVDGTSYYKLKIPEGEDRYVYNGVWINGMYADSVTIMKPEAMTQDEKDKYTHDEIPGLIGPLVYNGYTTEIRWFPQSIPKNFSFSFKAAADASIAQSDGYHSIPAIGTLYMNDRDNERLYSSPLYIPVSKVGADKEQLDENGDVINQRTTVVRDGETVHYRLTVGSYIDWDINILPEDLIDILPDTFDLFAWDKKSVSIRYAYKNSEETPDFPWEIRKVDGKYQIYWPEGVKVYAGHELYIYVDVTFPEYTGEENDLWEQYCNKADILTNSLVFEQGNPIIVSHRLLKPAKGYLETGVRQIHYGRDFDLNTYASDVGDLNTYYSEYVRYKSWMQFYVVVYNDGPGALYLPEIQSRFSSGIPLDGENFTLKYVWLLDDQDNFLNLPDNTQLMDAVIRNQVEYRDGNAIARFTISQPSNPGADDIAVDDGKGLCYLESNQALAFSFVVGIAGDSGNVEQTTAMPLHNPYGGSTGFAQIPQISSEVLYGVTVPNNGLGGVWSSYNAVSQEGFISQYPADEWLHSEVDLAPGNVVVGLEKTLIARKNADGIVTEYPRYAGPRDKLNWQLEIFNDGEDVLKGFTITETLPENHMLVKGEDVYLKTPGEQGQMELFSISDYEVVNNKITMYGVNGSKMIPIGEVYEWRRIRVRLYYNDKDELAVDFTVLPCTHYVSGSGATGEAYEYFNIEPGESSKITLWTENYTNIQSYKTLVNTAVVSLPQQEVDYSQVTRGRVVYDELGEPKGVQDRATVNITGGYATDSVTMVTDGTQTANSVDGGAITLNPAENGFQEFTYTLQVGNNVSGAVEGGISWLTIIDNLPEIGDTLTMNPQDFRESDFQVNFSKNPNVQVWYIDSNGSKVVIEDPDIRYSAKTKFDSDDWGTERAEPTQTEWSTDHENARSIRIFLKNPDGSPVIPVGATLYVSFQCSAGDNATVPGSVAWNNFGYRYLMNGSSFYMEASPLDVGVKLPDFPAIQKTLTDAKGNPYTADTAETFNFLLYAGEELPNVSTGEQLLAALSENGRQFTYIQLSVKDTVTQSLQDLKVYTYAQNSLQQTDTVWVWENGTKYTLVELGDELSRPLGIYHDYEFASVNNRDAISYTFTYDYSRRQTVHFENSRVSRELIIHKVDEANNQVVLQGAIFGLYTKDASQKLTDTELSNLYTELELTEVQKTELQAKLTIQMEGSEMYLCGLSKTDEQGYIRWSELPGDEYAYLELWAPEGYWITQTNPVKVSFLENDVYLREEYQLVTNKKIIYLPKTGGMGRWQIPALGLILCAAVVTVFLGKRRKKAA